jgi:hypothetical protein
VTNPHVGYAMDCARARVLIDAFLLDELGPANAARLAVHVKSCAACTAEIGGSTRVLGLLGSLPMPRPTPDLDERILMAALGDRARRHDHRSWLADLRTQVLRGAMRTTGTLVITILSVALLGAAFVFAASQFVNSFPGLSGDASIPAVATPTTSVPAAQTAEPSMVATPRPSPVVSTTPVPVITPDPATAEPAFTPVPPESTPEPTISVEPLPSATAEPTPPPTPSPTEKPRRTPPPPADPTPSP